jgi:serine/threonine protein kinase/tetratricopeptide (TPR) repeat protein
MGPALRANYEVIRQLGEGGIGRVYQALHHPSGRVVAIKTLRTEHGEASAQRLLLNEAAAAAQLAHPNIVELLDVGRDDNGSMFLVMELVRGSSLETWSTSFPGLRTGLRAFDEILDALSAAHAQGIVHGDLKPGNVLLTDDGHVKLTDFGIAHVIDPLRKVERRGVQGTPYYMAPEQLMDLAAIGPPADLYAVGVMLYELLAGHEPWAAEGTLGEIMARKVADVRPLSARPGLEIPPELAALVTELLDPDPRIRPRFAARVRHRLASIARLVPDARVPSGGEMRAPATWVESPLGSAPTISSSDELPSSKRSTRSLPFTLPCIAGGEPEVALHRLRPLPLLGRDAQAQRLLALEAAVLDGRGPRAMIVSGRAGEGKTRLLRHGFADVERRGTMLGAAASFDETIANAQVGLRACITRLLGAPRSTLGETLSSRWKWLEQVDQPGVDFERMFEWLAPGAQPLAAAGAAEVAAMCVLAASRVCPVYLWLDDVAWSRDGAMELVLRLLAEPDARVLVVGTLRSGTAEHPAVRAWLLEASAAGAALEMLPRLSAEDRGALLQAAGPVAPEVASELAGSLDEPALVLVESVRAWIDQGDLVPSERGYVLREGAAPAEMTARTPGAVLAHRIDTLLDAFGPEREHAERVLVHAALLGLRFEDRVLRACADVAPYVDAVLDRALLSGLLRVDGRGAYRFEHRLFLDAIVERCARRPDAGAIYCTTADALAHVYGRRGAEAGLITATLYRAGGMHEAAMRRACETARALARASLFDAADRALALIAGWLESDALPPMHLHRGLLEAARGQRYYFALDYPTARNHLNRARELFEALGSTGDLHNILFDISSTFFYQDQFAEAERYIEFAKQPVIADRLANARARHRMGELASLRGDLAGAMAHEKHALKLTGDDDPFFAMIALSTLAEMQVAAGEVDDAAASFDHAIALGKGTADRYLKGDLEHARAAIAAARGHFAEARAISQAQLDNLRQRGDKWQSTAALALQLFCAAALGDPRAVVERAARDFVDAYAEVPHDEALTWWAIRSAESYLRRRGHHRCADEVAAVHDARLARIARAFDDAEPITEEAAARSGAATGASSQ